MPKASDNEFPSVLFDEQASDPATPGAGLWRAFFKSGGLFVIDDTGAVTGPFGAGSSGGLTLISTVTLGADAVKMEFSGISAGYKDLLIVGAARTDRASNAVDRVGIQVGHTTIDTSTANYDSTYREEGNTASTSRDSATGYIRPAACPGNTGTAGYFSPFEVKILNYAVTGFPRGIVGQGGGPLDGTDHRLGQVSGIWENTADTIDIVRVIPVTGTNLKAGSFARLYGMS